MVADYYDYPFGKFQRPMEKCELYNDSNMIPNLEKPQTGTLDNVRM